MEREWISPPVRDETYLGDERAVRPADLRGRRHGGDAERGVQVGLAGAGRVGCGGHRRGVLRKRKERSRQRRANDVPTKGERTRRAGLRIRGGRRTEGRIAVAVAVAVAVRGVARGACVEVTRASDATTGRRAEENAARKREEANRRRNGSTDDSIGPIGEEPTRFIGTRWVNGLPTRLVLYSFSRLAWRPQKAQRRENPQPARGVRHSAETGARARF